MQGTLLAPSILAGQPHLCGKGAAPFAGSTINLSLTTSSAKALGSTLARADDHGSDPFAISFTHSDEAGKSPYQSCCRVPSNRLSDGARKVVEATIWRGDDFCVEGEILCV